MYAVIETGGKQYRVAPGDSLLVEKLEGEPGTAVEFDKVLAIGGDDGDLKTGEALSGARVKASIQNQDRAKKILVFKFKRKKQYKRTIGHRQHLTKVVIDEIVA
ncbi:MAG: 50S ribosomal protein L21 [Bryobacteraceae bacterium]|nr:50S ribosomal protein L21 [Bryobacteraceae bacterium]